MAVLDGVNLLVSVEGTTYGCLTNQSIDFTVDMLDSTCKDSNSYKTFPPGEKNATLTADLLYNYDATEGVVQAFEDLQAGTQVSWKWGDFDTSGGGYWYGEGYISNLTINGPKNEVANASITIQVTGEPGTTTFT